MKVLFICFSLFCIVGCGETNNSSVRIDFVDVDNHHDSISQEIVDGVDFVCQERAIDCGLFRENLLIKVYEDRMACGEKNCGGIYWWKRGIIYLHWYGGNESNSLIHELLHREQIFRYNGGVINNDTFHNPQFWDDLEILQNKWIKYNCRNGLKKNCIWWRD